VSLLFRNVTFRYDLSAQPLFRQFNADFHAGWSGVVGANGSGKTTLLYLAAGLLEPTEGRIIRPRRIVLCEQRTDAPPDDLGELLRSRDAEALRLRAALGIGGDWENRWTTLSHGERKRAQIAAALRSVPDVLLLDEPTNHVDAEVRSLLRDALARHRGVGILVSHDRSLLDDLCGWCVFLDPPRHLVFRGGYTRASEQRALDESRAAEAYQRRQRDVLRIEAEQRRRRAEASAADRRCSKRGLALHDSDGRAKINAARVSGADGHAGRLASQLDGRLRQAVQALREERPVKRYDMNFWLPDSHSCRNALLRMRAGTIQLGGGKTLAFPDLEIGPRDRIALSGPNGGGKSTLVRRILENVTLSSQRVLYMSQEVDLKETAELASRIAALPTHLKGLLMTVMSCLGSRPEQIIGHLEQSPGEVRKLLLAFGVTRSPHLIVMDEPTNHLDLPAVELLEGALASCPCALLLVSHDERFLGRLAGIRWRIAPGGHGESVLTVS
jgi:ATPase subunit of ABC transporter with duplicated ATPase domains